MIINEYDADRDEGLNFDEFVKLILPSTNKIQTELALDRSNNRYLKEQPLAQKAITQMSEHLCMELKFLKRRNEIKRQLLQREDFIKHEYFQYFQAIALTSDKITIRGLVDFVRTFANTTLKGEELEAILRRVNHEGDQQISYEEFCELVSSNEDNIKSAEDLD